VLTVGLALAVIYTSYLRFSHPALKVEKEKGVTGKFVACTYVIMSEAPAVCYVHLKFT
jgi:hypothetical protein